MGVPHDVFWQFNNGSIVGLTDLELLKKDAVLSAVCLGLVLGMEGVCGGRYFPSSTGLFNWWIRRWTEVWVERTVYSGTIWNGTTVGWRWRPARRFILDSNLSFSVEDADGCGCRLPTYIQTSTTSRGLSPGLPVIECPSTTPTSVVKAAKPESIQMKMTYTFSDRSKRLTGGVVSGARSRV